ncbi:Os11g0201933, partial [Oryza sativa Japonica Group]
MPDLRGNSMPDPEIYPAGLVVVVVVVRPEPELAHVERLASAEEEEVVHELPNVPHTRLLFHSPPNPILTLAPNPQACGRLPEVAPAASEHARLHGVPRRQERQHVVEDLVRERADAVFAAGLVLLGPLRWRHSVKQAVG